MVRVATRLFCFLFWKIYHHDACTLLFSYAFPKLAVFYPYLKYCEKLTFDKNSVKIFNLLVGFDGVLHGSTGFMNEKICCLY